MSSTSTQDEAKFEEAKEEMDKRVFDSVQSFFRLLSNEGATLRLVENDREFSFSREAIERARSRTDDVRIEDVPNEIMGQLWATPYCRKFELRTAGGDIIGGSIAPDALSEITSENDTVGVGTLGTWCVQGKLVDP